MHFKALQFYVHFWLNDDDLPAAKLNLQTHHLLSLFCIHIHQAEKPECGCHV